MRVLIRLAALAAALVACPVMAQDQDGAAGGGDAELAKKLANPVSTMISLPLQLNYDCCVGPSDGARALLNVQPVIPFSLNENWSVVTRTIVPIVLQESPSPGVRNAFGVGDVQQSFFFTRAKPSSLILAFGPVIEYPTGSNTLGSEKWGLGPTLLVLKQEGRTTVGLLANHIWSVAGDDDRSDISRTFIQPIFSYVTPKATTYSVNSEATYDWQARKWSIPINASVSHLFKVGEQRVSLGVGGRVYVDGEENQPNWGLRIITTFLFPT